jgi:ParB family chromosome partitioning protein
MKHPFSRLFGIEEKQEEKVETKESIEMEDLIEIKKQEEVRQIPIKDIVPNRFQPRTIFVDERIEELAQTIRTHGIIQPIIVREYENEKFEIIAGERRWRAVTFLEWETIPAIIKDFNDTETASVALIENLQREELSPIEEAIAYSKLLELHNLTQEALAQRLGKGQSTVANKLRLLQLPQPIQDALVYKKITERHARALIALKKSPELQESVLNDIIELQLNVKQTEDRVVRLLEGKKKKPKPKFKAFSKDTRIAMNTIRQSLDMVGKTGMKVESDEQEFDDYIQFTIKIPKK